MDLTQELCQDLFDPHEFIDRIAWRTIGSINKENIEQFDPAALNNAFQKIHKELDVIGRRQARLAEKLEEQCKQEENLHWNRVAEIQRKNQAAYGRFQELDEKISSIATKVVHVGDQLEAINIQRIRDAEALRLMLYFQKFLSDNDLVDALFTDPNQIASASGLILSLRQIALELPTGTKYDKAQKRIEEKYQDMQNRLIDNFLLANQTNNKTEMRRIVILLGDYREGYMHCVDRFIEACLRGAFRVKDKIIDEILPLAKQTEKIVVEVFPRPENVMAKFILFVFQGVLQDYINERMPDQPNPEAYLKMLYDLYSRTVALSNQIQKEVNIGNEPSYLQKLTYNIFAPYLAGNEYIKKELSHLQQRCADLMHLYYQSKGHQRKQIASGNIGQMIQHVFTSTEKYSSETFLSQEVALSILQEYRLALRRSQVLSSKEKLPEHAVQILEYLIEHLIVGYIMYAVELGLLGLPGLEPKTEPDTLFLSIVDNANAIISLYENLFRESLLPLVSGTSSESTALQKKTAALIQLELKIDQGVDKLLGSMMSYLKLILQMEQKRSDYKPEGEEGSLPVISVCCNKVISLVDRWIATISATTDGRNRDAILSEMGLRFHRVIYENLLQFQYNNIGAMLAICDVNEYRRCARTFGVNIVNQAFDTLHELCNLLIVFPENLVQCSRERLAYLDRSVIVGFVQLRSDYKTAKLAEYFR